MGVILVYGEMARRVGSRKIEWNTAGKRLIDILKEFAKKFNVEDLLFYHEKVRPMYLILVDGRDYLSLGLLNSKIEKEDVEIRIVPTFHGG